jgi:catechol 2,3-dioxygenase-like lactoylglutathione lyase family enzyme
MLASAPVAAVVAVSDMEKGKEFYEGTLGLQKSDMDDPGGVLYECGNDSRILVYVSQYAGTNQATAATWLVADVDREIADLKAKGVSFEHYDLPETTRDGDVHVMGDMKAAWFKDPDGNILNIVSREPAGA